MVYGEYFPNPGVARDLGWSADCVSRNAAFLAEGRDGLAVAFLVFALTDGRNLAPKGWRQC